MSELKPCPFCGVQSELISGRIYTNHSQFCILYATVVYDFKKTAWNTRPIEDELRMKLKIAVEALEQIKGDREYTSTLSDILVAKQALRRIRE